VYGVDLFDIVGNRRLLSTADLQAAGFSTNLNVVSEQDITPPVLTAFSFTPTTIDTTSGAATVTVTASITDDLSGTATGAVYFYSPSQNQHRSCFFTFPQTGLVTFNGTCSTEFLSLGEAGTWTVYGVDLFDIVGNRQLLSTADLQAAGFPTDLIVNTTP
jgi:hypothetical protein